MDGETIITLIGNFGFAIGVAAYLIKWMTNSLNAKIDEIVELQNKIVELQRQLAETQKEILLLLAEKKSEVMVR